MLVSAMLACLAATAALRPPATFRASLDRVQRSRHVVAQYEAPTLPVGWISALDQESGLAYYCEEASGECQWELPQPGAAALQEYAQTLPTGWISAVDQESGATYYFHEQTGISQWELPAHEIRVDEAAQQIGQLYPVTQHSEPPQQTAGQAERAQLVWRVASIHGWGPRFAGKYKVRPGEEAVLGRYDMFGSVPTRPWVSRKQCLVHVADDGMAVLVSRGKPPTGWRSRDTMREGGPWAWLMYDEVAYLSDGDQVSLDYQDPEGTVLTCTLEG